MTTIACCLYGHFTAKHSSSCLALRLYNSFNPSAWFFFSSSRYVVRHRYSWSVRRWTSSLYIRLQHQEFFSFLSTTFVRCNTVGRSHEGSHEDTIRNCAIPKVSCPNEHFPQHGTDHVHVTSFTAERDKVTPEISLACLMLRGCAGGICSQSFSQ